MLLSYLGCRGMAHKKKLTTTQKSLLPHKKNLDVDWLIFFFQKIEWLAHKNPKIRKLGRNLTKHTKITHKKHT